MSGRKCSLNPVCSTADSAARRTGRADLSPGLTVLRPHSVCQRVGFSAISEDVLLVAPAGGEVRRPKWSRGARLPYFSPPRGQGLNAERRDRARWRRAFSPRPGSFRREGRSAVGIGSNLLRFLFGSQPAIRECGFADCYF